MVVWDNLPAHAGPAMHTFIDAHADWLTVFRLPAYAPELNPAKGVWASLKRSLVHLAPRGIDQLVTLIKSHLKRMQYRPALLGGFIAQSGLTLEPP